jgi:two-component system, OmpR family, copper resistance phosphate regulon response regulator CusR
MRILIIEDNYDIRNFLRESLQAETYAVDTAEDGERGSYLARTNQYDLIILDNTLPKKNGIQVCSEIRRIGKDVPIIMLSVDAGVDKKVLLLDSGADDYMTKPFSYKELLARIKALFRRPKAILQDILTFRDYSIDIAKQRVVKGSKEIYLTRKEFALMEYLARNKGSVVSRGTIMEHVWDMDNDPFSNTIETHILNLRKKLDKTNKQRLIVTVPGRGYMIEEE